MVSDTEDELSDCLKLVFTSFIAEGGLVKSFLG